MEKKSLGKKGEIGKIYDNEGKAHSVKDWFEKQRLEDLKKELQRIVADGRSNKEKIRDFIIQNGYATRKELIQYFNKNGILQIMSEKTVDNNLKTLRQEGVLILEDEEDLRYVYNYNKPLISSEYTSEKTLRAYKRFTENKDYSEYLKKHNILKRYLNTNIGYKLYYKGEEDKDFYFSNQNINEFASLMNKLLYKCFLMNPDMFYRFRNKEDFYFSILITVELSRDRNFDDFLERYNEMKEIVFRRGFPSEAEKATTQRETKEFVKYYEERQRAVAKFQHEKRDKGITEILKMQIPDNEKSIRIQNFLREIELETYSKFSLHMDQEFD
ncbi:MAG: hypothetical protein ACFFDB_02785 [Promethearchaeota archaeon]